MLRPSACRTRSKSPQIALPDHVAGSGQLDRLVDTARGYADHAIAENTRRAYARDWAGFAR
ncbi:hypothetical protein FHS00_002633 [Limimaricola variabilis]|uniref:Integrase n=1 Tax=Limimaricola variabilis TaxID=1492771 RepID=A0ABR6HR52_9RHOB|nr:hypothetical protein [Limimaricola variabilis]